MFKPYVVSSYDKFISDEDGIKLTDFPIGVASAELAVFLEESSLIWDGEGVAFGARLYTPSSWEQGQRVSFRDDTYNGTKIDDPNIGLIFEGDGYSDELIIDISSLPSGTYDAKVREINGTKINVIVIKH